MCSPDFDPFARHAQSTDHESVFFLTSKNVCDQSMKVRQPRDECAMSKFDECVMPQKNTSRPACRLAAMLQLRYRDSNYPSLPVHAWTARLRPTDVLVVCLCDDIILHRDCRASFTVSEQVREVLDLLWNVVALTSEGDGCTWCVECVSYLHENMHREQYAFIFVLKPPKCFVNSLNSASLILTQEGLAMFRFDDYFN